MTSCQPPMRRIVVITGSSRGIGAGIARVFAKADWVVVGADVIEPTAEVGNALAEHHHLDVTNLQEIRQFLRAKYPYINCLVNNAGVVSVDTHFDQVIDEQWDTLMAVNLRGPFVMCRELYSLLMKAPKGTASVVNLSSAVSQSCMPNQIAYTTSKGGVASMTRALALELGKHKIRCNAICPGFIATSMTVGHFETLKRRVKTYSKMTTEQITQVWGNQSMIGRPGTPEDIGQLALFLADYEKSSYYTGQCILADGGQLAKM